jgi:hypothetical protein
MAELEEQEAAAGIRPQDPEAGGKTIPTIELCGSPQI